ncbi:hypothetical protein PDE_00402 [Penicillium oxalicum 114-2]|uniref:Uncharacterized protein n=1 Tax=Penicillium oxalicum (strain 114-2 / CGMCC 5302) TaxID=933388 RepID=S7Z5S3_PENO1|nr:hypothetical protein PDE_00402 [Penicillium oxalicum 114-2]
MSTQTPQSPDPSGLGESWVIASTTLTNEQKPSSATTVEPVGSETTCDRVEENRDTAKTANDTRQTPDASKAQSQREKELSESLASSASSWGSSGPELVMPSFYEVPISEASWVAPDVPSTGKSSPHMRKRRKITPDSKKIQNLNRRLELEAEVPPSGLPTSGHGDRKPSISAQFSSLYRNQQTRLRLGLNTILITLIMHLLVLPEIIYQAPALCAVPFIHSTYSSSCIALHPRPLPSSPFHLQGEALPREVTTIATQHTLQAIFASTLSTLMPLSHVLKDSESTLSTLQTNLQTSLPEARNALDLEFQGSEAALRAAAWEFDSLRADLRSATDSLLASPVTMESGDATSIARDTRFAAQLRRRGEYLDRLRTQLRNKAESLGGRFATLDDHLEAIESIVSREARRAWMDGGDFDPDGGAKFRAEGLLQSLSNYAAFSARLFGAGSGARPSDQSADADALASGDAESVKRPTSTLALLRLAATQHRAVADEVARLARALREEQRARSDLPW